MCHPSVYQLLHSLARRTWLHNALGGSKKDECVVAAKAAPCVIRVVPARTASFPAGPATHIRPRRLERGKACVVLNERQPVQHHSFQRKATTSCEKFLCSTWVSFVICAFAPSFCHVVRSVRLPHPSFRMMEQHHRGSTLGAALCEVQAACARDHMLQRLAQPALACACLEGKVSRSGCLCWPIKESGQRISQGEKLPRSWQ